MLALFQHIWPYPTLSQVNALQSAMNLGTPGPSHHHHDTKDLSFTALTPLLCTVHNVEYRAVTIRHAGSDSKGFSFPQHNFHFAFFFFLQFWLKCM